MASLNGYQIAAKLTGHHEPYELSTGPHLFCDIRFIEAGGPAYFDEDGNQVGLKDPGPVRTCYARPKNVSHGIPVIAEKAEKSEPIEGTTGGPVIYDGNLYRSWDGANCYESEDGFTWKKPDTPGEEGVA